jgi:hypothetical protein
MIALQDYNAVVDLVDRNVAEGRGGKTTFIKPLQNITHAELREVASRTGPVFACM